MGGSSTEHRQTKMAQPPLPDQAAMEKCSEVTQVNQSGYYDKETKKEVVIKRDLKKKEALVNEIRLYDAMKYTPGFPKMLWYGEDGDRYFMALEKLDYSLGTCFKECGEKFSEKTIFMLAD